MRNNTDKQELINPDQRIPIQTSASPLDLPVETFKAGLDRRQQNRSTLMHWVRSALVEGTDFGRIQTKRGLSKPSLWKPGAEKLCGMLGITVHYPTLSEFEKAALAGIKLNQIILRCELKDASGRVVADGVGARSLVQDQGDMNKALKMSEKSAHIDATLRFAGLSEVFTQDLEDFASGQALQTHSITEFQVQQLERHIHELGLDRNRVKQWLAAWTLKNFGYAVLRFQDLRHDQLQPVLERLDSLAERQASQSNSLHS